MADDIVTRLRNPQLPCICVDVVLPSCHPCNARLDAADEIERLQRTVKDRDEWNDHLSEMVSFLLLAVPRPFRMAVNRKAVRLLEEEARRG